MLSDVDLNEFAEQIKDAWIDAMTWRFFWREHLTHAELAPEILKYVTTGVA